MRKINKLTQKQRDQMPAWRDKWIAKGLQTGETDWDTFEKYIKICYEKADIKWPNKIVRVSSPYVGALASAIARAILDNDSAVDSAVGSEVDSAVDSAVGSEVDSEVYSAVRSAVESAVHSEVDSSVRSAVGSAVGSAVRSAVDSAVDSAVYWEVGSEVGSVVHSAVESAVDSAVYSVVRSAIKDIAWHPWFGGQFWVGGWWGSPSYISFFTEVCGLELDPDIQERATAYQKICESVNYFWTNRNFVMVCARPSEIHRDDQGRLHNENGMAIEYPDGWGLYVINGVTVDEQIVMSPETLTVEQIQKEENEEKRRIMVERFGVDRYLADINAKVIDVDLKNTIGAGARALMEEGDTGNQWLICTDGSTDRVYHLFVGRGHSSCRSAHEAICGFNEDLIKAEG